MNFTIQKNGEGLKISHAHLSLAVSKGFTVQIFLKTTLLKEHQWPRIIIFH